MPPTVVGDTLSLNYTKCFLHYSRPALSIFFQATFPPPPLPLTGPAVTRNLSKQWNDIAAIHQFSCPLLYAVLTETGLTEQTLAKDQLRCVLLHHVFTELLWGHFRPISSWMSERKICWVEWLKVWDNGTVNNQEMGSKRILKRSQLRPPPPTSGTSSGSSRGDNSAGKRSNVDFFRMRHHRNLIDNFGNIMKGLEINSKSDVPILVGKVEINPTKQFGIVLNWTETGHGSLDWVIMSHTKAPCKHGCYVDGFFLAPLKVEITFTDILSYFDGK